MEAVRHRRWLKIFATIAILVIAQVTWWDVLFLGNARTIAHLQEQLLSLAPAAAPLSTPEKIHGLSIRRQVMFISESSFFAVMACVGLYVLYRALTAEERSRVIQRNFIEVVTHESKTPITALKLRLESVLERWKADAVLGSQLTLALEEVRRLSSIFEKVLSLNRMERHAFTFEPTVLADVVRAVTHRMEPLLAAKNVKLVLELDTAITVSGDLYGLQSSVQSLLENAVLYNQGEQKRVEVKMHVEGNRVSLLVADNGPGIAAKDQQRIFERFYRARSSGPVVPGTGLGLYIAKTIIDAHGGGLRLVDTSQNGTCFEISLPVVDNGDMEVGA